jgi:hypothetical protein
MTDFSGFALLRGINGFGFLNSLITLLAALVFAIAGFHTLGKGENQRLSANCFQSF